MEAHVNILTKLPQFNKLEANLAPLLTKASKKAITEAMYRSSFRKNCSNKNNKSCCKVEIFVHRFVLRIIEF